MRGYFGIGVEGISKEQNVGTIARSAHSFGASFFFAINPAVDIKALRISDTSGAFDHLPYYQYKNAKGLALPMKCTLVGIEFVEDSVEMPSFRHPTRAAYIFGPEMGNLSGDIVSKCHHIVKIPMKFCVNVGVAAAITMYDRMICMGRFAERPVRPGGPLVEEVNPRPVTLRKKVRYPKE
ncbi:MAG: TrmH family RNA methyltransferase [Alphaproteobacteria bacterium]|nr:TrmH family RNA methyltransferase [Alphaproteobacteria bacterium]